MLLWVVVVVVAVEEEEAEVVVAEDEEVVVVVVVVWEMWAGMGVEVVVMVAGGGGVDAGCRCNWLWVGGHRSTFSATPPTDSVCLGLIILHMMCGRVISKTMASMSFARCTAVM